MESSKISLRDIALAAGVSKTTVSDALNNRPDVSKATRELVLRTADSLGYTPDARIASWMASVRDAKSKDLLPIIWLNTTTEEDSWRKYKFLSPYYEGAALRARQLGYRLDDIWLREPGMTVRRFSRIIRQRGVEAIVLHHHQTHLRLDLEHLAAIDIGGMLISPRLDNVRADIFYNLRLALKMLIRNGYRRIGVCLTRHMDRGYSHACRAAVFDFHASYPNIEAIPPLFYQGEDKEHWPYAKKEISDWLLLHKPEVVVCHSNFIVRCVENTGFRVPGDIGVVHLATDDDVPDWAGINSNRRLLGSIAIETLISLAQSRQFGAPEFPRAILIRGVWHPGSTLLLPRPK